MIKDKKNMKKRWKRIISNMIAIALVIISSIPTISIPVKAEASVDGKLITVGGKTVTKNMKIDDVKKMFGEPKLTTPSYWDGYAYTFYGKDYSDYLYLETDSDGKIVCYGSVSPGFETNKYSYGEKVNSYVRVGCEATDNDENLYGAIYYTEFHLDAYDRFTKNLTKNNRNLCKHAVEMWNAIAYLYGYKTETYFDEKLFNIGAQLADNHSDLYDYCMSTNQSSCYQLMTQRTATFLQYYYPNPLEFAQNSRHYKCQKGNAIGFMYYPTGEGNTLQQACHKLSGTQSSNVDVVAWPPKGITISESGFSPSGMWTCQFYNKLKPTADTTITIECLNSNKKWKIDPNNLLENQDYNYERSGDLISYSDDSIVFKIGGVYQITYDHLTDANGNETSYSYRTVYEKAYIGSEEEKVPQSIKLDKTSEKVLLGTTSKLIAKVSPDNIKNKRIYFASNNKEVATVNECGEITAHSLGTADITATSENGNITATCKIIVVKTLDQTDDQPEKEPTKEPEKEPTGAITNGNVNNSNNKSDLSQGHKTNNSKKENITISKAKIKSAKKKKSSKSLTIILSKAVPKVIGYQIKIYSSKKKAKKNKGAIWTKVVQTNSKKIVIKNKKLKNKKTLYIRIRAYKRINRKNKYSTWSEIKKVIVN